MDSYHGSSLADIIYVSVVGWVGPRAILMFDLLIAKVDRFMPLPLVPIGINIGSFIFEPSCSQIWRTKEQAENLVPPPIGLA